MGNKNWIGCDLDGTLAEYTGWKGKGHIGPIIPLMKERVLRWLAQGIEVKIFTARAVDKENIPLIRKWLNENGLPELEITNVKDYLMVQLWDDRCVQVEQNTGKVNSFNTQIIGDH